VALYTWRSPFTYFGKLIGIVPRDVAEEKKQFDATLGQFKKTILQHQMASKWSTIDAVEQVLKNESQNLQCPLCHHSFVTNQASTFESHCIFGGGLLIRHQCPQCEVIFGPEKMLRLSEKELSQEYDWHYSMYEEGDSTDLELKAFYALEPSKEKIYLNYGAGAWSKSLQKLRDDGWQVYGFEPHAELKNQYAYSIQSWDALSAMQFDGVFSNNVLEHFRHPVEELKKIVSLLKPNGKMAHATPCYAYQFEYTRFHLFFFTGKSNDFLWDAADLKPIQFVQDGIFMCHVLEPKQS
jgi:SAM-dependent methyltransferase